MGKYIPWWLIGKRRKDAANQILASASNYDDAEERVRTAIRAGADPNFTIEKLSLNYFGGKEQFTKRQIEILREDIKKSNKIEQLELLESTELPLFTALKMKNQALVSFLINAGATINEEIFFYAIDRCQDQPKGSDEIAVAESIINAAKKAGIYESMLKKQNEGIENELMKLVNLSDNRLKPVPNNWTVYQSLLFLALLAGNQQKPKDDLIQATSQIVNALGVDFSRMGSSQMIIDWGESLSPEQMGMAIIAHTQAIMGLNPSVLANQILPAFEYLAKNVGDIESINNAVVKTFKLFLGLDQQDSD